MREFFGQTSLFLLGLFIELGIPLILNKDYQKRFIRVLGGLLILIALVWFGYELGSAQGVEEIPAQVEMSSEKNDEDSSSAQISATPLPTYTSYPTYTPAPTKTLHPTSTVVPTKSTKSTQKPSATSLPSFGENTSPDTKLKVGMPWKQDGFYVTLQLAKPMMYGAEPAIRIMFYISNETDQPLSVSADIRDVTVETNTGELFEFRGNYCDFTMTETIEAGDTVRATFCGVYWHYWYGDYFSSDIEYLLVTVRNWGRIDEAVWQVDINH